MGKIVPKGKETTRSYILPVTASQKMGQVTFDSNDWKTLKGEKVAYQDIQVFAVTDPYTLKMRKEFRSANSNAYIYRAGRIMTSFVAGQGWTTKAVPRNEEE